MYTYTTILSNCQDWNNINVASLQGLIFCKSSGYFVVYKRSTASTDQCISHGTNPKGTLSLFIEWTLFGSQDMKNKKNKKIKLFSKLTLWHKFVNKGIYIYRGSIKRRAVSERDQNLRLPYRIPLVDFNVWKSLGVTVQDATRIFMYGRSTCVGNVILPWIYIFHWDHIN